MISLLASNPLAFFIVFPGLLLAIAVHEFAHAFIADKLGDPTPRYQGRVTLNPLAHLDPIGTLAILLTRFGWGKPVPFDPYNLKDPVRDTALISIAGPISNIVMASVLALVLRLGLIGPMWINAGLFQVLVINIVLAIFNLIPVAPLDGSKIITAFLPRTTAIEYEQFMSRYGIIVLLFLIFPFGGVSPATLLIWPVIEFIVNVLV
ncbi:MAG TPA: site-2 protease family protein [Patescibacteria group bacterium]